MISSTRDDIMGMPITVTIVDRDATQQDVDAVFSFFQGIDNRFSTYKKESEISKFNRGGIKEKDVSDDMKEVFYLSEQTKQQTDGYFTIQTKDGTIDPSGLVKGWAIQKASDLLTKRGCKNYFIDAGGDIQAVGLNSKQQPWRVGIRNPFNRDEIVKVVYLINKGIATSGTSVRGQHVYNPHNPDSALTEIVSVSVIGPNVYEADRFATAAFAMQEKGIHFLEQQKDVEGYMIDRKGVATMTSGFENYVKFS